MHTNLLANLDSVQRDISITVNPGLAPGTSVPIARFFATAAPTLISFFAICAPYFECSCAFP